MSIGSAGGVLDFPTFEENQEKIFASGVGAAAVNIIWF